jgi:DNA-binding transcriptional ArsR family regulator
MSTRSDILTAERCETECVHPEHVTPLLGRVLDYSAADRVAATFGVLADPTRARIVHALSIASDELCVCDLAVLLGISQSALSHQLRLLRDRDVVARTKRGRMVYYRLADEHIRHVFTDGLRHAGESVVTGIGAA